MKAASALAAMLLLVAACDHTRPASPTRPADLGPFPGGEPVRLTFYDLDDKQPRVTGDLLVFTRQDRYGEPNPLYAPTGRETCIAVMPAIGGTIRREHCPNRLAPDTLVDTWFGAALSPDRTRIAFNWQRAYRPALGYLDTYLVVAPAGAPGDSAFYRQAVHYNRDLNGIPALGDVASHITWVDDTRLRYLATVQHVFRVMAPAGRAADTAFTPLALLELDLTTGATDVIGDSVIAFATAPGGMIWVVREAAAAMLESLDPATGTRDTLGMFTGAVTSLAAVDGVPVAVIQNNRVERIDLATGTAAAVLDFGRPVRAIAAGGDRRFIVEVEQGFNPSGSPTDLWRATLP